MPFLPFLLLGGGLGTGFLLGYKATDITKMIVIGGVIYFIVIKNKQV